MTDRMVIIPPALAPLASQKRWVVWRWIKGKDGKLTKPPFQASAPGRFASSTDPSTWSDAKTAVLACTEGKCDGIGFVLGEDCAVAANDIDDCIDNGTIHPWAGALVERSNSYCEVTPSGEGLRIIGLSDGGPVHRKFNVVDGVSCELYRKATRYITVTGNQIGEAAALSNIDGLIDGLLEELDGARQTKAGNGADADANPKRDLASLIKDGCGTDFGGDRSRATWHVVNQLLRHGKTADEIVAIIIDPANGISAHCLDQPHSEKYARRQVEKAQQKQSGDPDSELERLARLSMLEYERQRKEAAERLNVRTSMLDRLVAATRDNLGLLDQDDDKQGRAVSLPEPEPWPEAVDGAVLLDATAAAIRRHVVLSETACDATAVWIVHTYLADRFPISPRLGVVSPTKRCGKTTLLDVLGCLVLRPLPTANVTPAAVFRVIEMFRPTLLIDEADTFIRDSDELRGVLNSGHRKGGQVLRTVGEDHEPRAFSTYGPCAVALIGALPDTLSDRAVAIDLKRRLKTEQIEPFRCDRAGHLDVLARKAARWASDNGGRVGELDPEVPEGIINREADNWRPLLAIAEVAGGNWPERARKAAEAAHAAGGEGEAAPIEVLLGDIKAIFAEKGEDKLTSADLVEALVKIEGRPWAELGRNRKPLTQNRLARMLKPLGIAPAKIRVADKTPNGYLATLFADAFARFCPEGGSELEHRNNADEIKTSEALATGTEDENVPVAKCEKSNNGGLSSGVPVAKGENPQNAHVPPREEPPGLSAWRVRQLADVYMQGADAQFEATGDVDRATLDRELRQALAVEVFPEFIEIEFERVMKVVFAV